MKPCPFCAEEIQNEAVKCKHCGSYMDEPVGSARKKSIIGLFMIIIPIIGILAILFWVDMLPLADDPLTKLTVVIGLTVLSTAILAAVEANNMGMVKDRKKGTYSPVEWFFLLLLLWIVGYPAYMFKRKHVGQKNLLAGGLVIMIFFSGISYFTYSRLEKLEARYREKVQNLQNMMN